MSSKRALIIGAGGQDGPYLASQLIRAGYAVSGISRKHSDRLESLNVEQYIYNVNLNSDLIEILRITKPTILVNLLSKSSVSECQSNPEASYATNFELAKFILCVFDAHLKGQNQQGRFIQASSSEMFGRGDRIVTENSQMSPATFYGMHKLLMHDFTLNFKSDFVKAISVILFNHESPFRSEKFVSSKVATAIAQVAITGETNLKFGNIQSKRDWGYALDYMSGITQIIESGKENCYLLASGESHSVQEMLRIGFESVNIFKFEHMIQIDKSLQRSVESGAIIGDTSKIVSELAWKPEMNFNDLAAFLVKEKIAEIKNRR